MHATAEDQGHEGGREKRRAVQMTEANRSCPLCGSAGHIASAPPNRRAFAGVTALLLVLLVATAALARESHDPETEEHALGVLHPMLVHFPLALGLSAALGVLAGIFFRGPFLRNWVTLTITLAAVFSVPAYFLGGQAEAELGRMSASRAALVETHATWGAIAMYTLLGVAVIRLLSVRWSSRGLLWVSRLAVLGAAAVLARTGYLGAEVVRGPNHLKGILPW